MADDKPWKYFFIENPWNVTLNQQNYQFPAQKSLTFLWKQSRSNKHKLFKNRH